MQKQIFFLVLLSTILRANTAKSKYNDDDEDHPYEFGFTIDGQQHRHEKKDANGIIQGEFGFITADGIYHVTVYATDENGNFRILSMKNIRISGPLDEPNAKLPDTSQFSKGNPQPQPPTPNPLSIQTPKPTTTGRPNLQFTTQSTIKPACAGCGYVTKPPNNKNENKLPFQTSAILNPKPGTVVIGSQPETPIISQDVGFPSSTGNGNPPNAPTFQDNYNHPGSPGFGSNLPGSGHSNKPGAPVSQFDYNDSPGSSGFGNFPDNTPNLPVQEDPLLNPLNIPNNKPNNDLDLHNNPPPNGITVDNGVINIPNNPPIPIQDKYPGMVDGLPNGITQGDITDLLYKFNYTVGFHGHYEKGYKNGAKVGGYFVNDRDGVSRIVTYVADENGYRPKVKFIRLDLNSDLVPKEGTEKTFGLKNFEFIWYPIN